MGEASVRAGYAFEFALQRSFETNQQGSKDSRSNGEPIGILTH
jgi:hypothetical protein